MPDVFISYSRKDKDFVRDLHTRLSALNRDTWVDWEDIPLTADWWQEIQRGIEAADSFLFVISPDSIASEVCTREIEHAIQHSKRLIPVVRREAVTQRVHEALSRHNWLFMRDGDDLEASFGQLMLALDTDLDYVREHTRLLVRAREWDSLARAASYVLRGEDLQNAENWLASSARKEPQPSDLQREYIFASRRAANARQRTILAGVSTALVVAAVLSVISFALFGLAETRRAESDLRGTEVAQQAATATNALGLSEVRGTEVAQQAATATNALGLSEVRGTEVAQGAATAIAAEATAVRRADESQSLGWAFASRQVAGAGSSDLALLLALQANTIPNPPPLARAQLAQVAYAPGARAVFAGGHDDWVNAVDVSPDRARVLSGGGNAELVLWDAETGAILQQHSFGAAAGAADGFLINLNTVEDVHFATDETALVLTGGDLVVWDVSAWREVRRMRVGATLATALDATANGSVALVGYGDGKLRVWDTETGVLIRLLAGHSEEVDSVRLSADGRRALSTSWDARLRWWDVKEGHLLQDIEPEYTDTDDADAYAVLFADDETHGIIGADTGEIIMYELATRAEVARYDLDQAIYSLEWSPDEERIGVALGDLNLVILDPESGDIIRRFAGHTGSANRLAFSPDGTTLYSAGADGTVRAWWVDGGAQVAHQRPFSGGTARDPASPQQIAVLPDGRWLVGGDEHDPALLVMDAALQTELARMEGHEDAILSIAVRSDGREAITGAWDGGLIRWDVETGAILDQWSLDDRRVFSVVYTPDEDQFIITTATISFPTRSAAVVYDIETREVVHTLQHGSFGVLITAQFIDLDGVSQLVLAGGDIVGGVPADYLAIFDPTTWAQQRRFESAHNGAIMAVAFHAGSGLLVSAGDDGTLVVWDARTGAERRRFIGHSGVVRSVDFSPDGTLVVSGAFDSTVRVWERGTWEELIRLEGHSGRVRQVLFVPGGQQVVSIGEDGRLITWQVATQPDAVRAWLPTHRYVREFTCIERTQYLIMPLCG
jgi:WD40 repeat protein